MAPAHRWNSRWRRFRTLGQCVWGSIVSVALIYAFVATGRPLWADASPASPRNSWFACRLAPTLKVGNRVEVKGKFLPDGAFAADAVEVKPTGHGEELRGQIEWVDSAEARFRMLGFTVQTEGE